MPYEGEFAKHQSIVRIAENERVKELLGRAKVSLIGDSHQSLSPLPGQDTPDSMPHLVLAIDGSTLEVEIKSDYPGARVGYFSVACVLIDLSLIEILEKQRPFDPVTFRETERTASIDAALPGCNVVTRRRESAEESFREELFDRLSVEIIDENDKIPLIRTYETLLSHKPASSTTSCPYKYSEDCEGTLRIQSGHAICPDCGGVIYSTDALRIHERFKSDGTNEEAFSYVMQIWERILLVHLLLSFEKQKLLSLVGKLAFFLDGPLAVFGPPAWLSAAIQTELCRINEIVKAETGNDLTIVGIEKSGNFVNHFEQIEQPDSHGNVLFPPGSYAMLTDTYIKERILQTHSTKRYGADTYFGRKFFYKTRSGARIVASIPFLSEEQDTLESDDASLFPQFDTVCGLLDNLVSTRFPNALSPIVSAHAQAAIPLSVGTKVLQQLAKVLMGEE